MNPLQLYRVQLSSVQSLSHVWLFATPWTPARQASLSITNSQSPPKPMSTESVMPSNHLILCCPLLLLPSIFPRIMVFSNESALCIRWPKYWSFSFKSVLPILVKPHAPSLPSLSQDLPLVPSSSSLYITWWWWWFSHTKLCPSLAIPWTVAWQDPLPWDFPGKNTRGGCHFLLQGIFLTQRLNLGLLHCSQILYRWASREDLISPTPSL